MRRSVLLHLSAAYCLTLPAAATAQTVTSTLQAALFAQVSGLGGCHEIEQVRSFPVRYFPSVQFVKGECTLEHGDTARPIVAVDSSNQVYVLDSESAFLFLIRQHPPMGLDSLSAVDYVHLALVLSGQLPEDAQLVFDKQQVPDSLARQVGIVRDGLIPSRVDAWRPERRSIVQITAFTSYAVYWTDAAILSPKTGEVYAAVSEWTEGAHRVR